MVRIGLIRLKTAMNGDSYKHGSERLSSIKHGDFVSYTKIY